MSSLIDTMNALINNNPHLVLFAIGIAKATPLNDDDAIQTAVTEKVKSWGIKNTAEETETVEKMTRLVKWFQFQPPA